VTVAIDGDAVIQGIVAGELNKRAFEQMAGLAMGGGQDEEIVATNPVITQPWSEE